MRRLRRSLLTLLNPSFHAFLLRRGAISLYQSILSFQAERSVAGATRGARLGRRVTIQHPEGLQLAEGVTIGDDTELLMDPGPGGRAHGSIALGRNVKIGQRVLIGPGPHAVHVGDHSSIHNGCALLGSVVIGRYCLLSCNIFISSADHFFDQRPEWLVRDQDVLGSAAEDYAHSGGRSVVIEDDCWIGWGAVIRRGVYIGKGAVIGANAVVTRDVAPYSINGGAPCRQLGERLSFRPSRQLSAGDEQHWPYFYSGFLLHQRDLESSLKSGVVLAGQSVRLLLAGGSCRRLQVRGRSSAPRPLPVRVSLDGTFLQRVELAPGEFAFDLPIGAADNGDRPSPLPQVLRDFHELRLDTETRSPSNIVEPQYGIATVALE